MADTPEVQETEQPAEPAAQQQQQQQQMAQRQQVQIDITKANVAYANFCRVTGTPEELIIDFGLNAQPFGPPTEALVIAQRLVLNFYTAKRLLAALSMTMQRHEAAFGVLETDVQKRVQPAAMRQMAAPQQR